MDENRRGYNLKAPGPSGSSSMRLPGRGSFPRVDDHLVDAEVTRDEIIGGHRIVASPAHPPHANQQNELDFVLRAHAAPGYRAATDLLTRVDEDSDFASDTCVYKDGVDPATGARYLEEIAFEVVSEQNERWVTEKARRMHRRGVRRIFSVWVKTQRICEWSPESGGWFPLEASSQIEDSCLVAPLSISALLDAAKADFAVIEAMAAKGSPAIRHRDAVIEAKSIAGSILEVLEARGIAVSAAQMQDILDCQDLDRLRRWVRQAAVASSAEEITSEP